MASYILQLISIWYWAIGINIYSLIQSDRSFHIIILPVYAAEPFPRVYSHSFPFKWSQAVTLCLGSSNGQFYILYHVVQFSDWSTRFLVVVVVVVFCLILSHFVQFWDWSTGSLVGCFVLFCFGSSSISCWSILRLVNIVSQFFCVFFPLSRSFLSHANQFWDSSNCSFVCPVLSHVISSGIFLSSSVFFPCSVLSHDVQFWGWSAIFFSVSRSIPYWE